MKLGVCYYPEHWPEAWWEDDARRMVEMGISLVRIAEFAWSRLEPTPVRLEWAWLDRAIETLHRHGLKVVMCTPTATPPKWLVDAQPDMIALDAQGHPRGFGSRRHYCFSSGYYREQSQRITELVAKRYGQHPAVAAWQTDNEYGCHDTVLSYSANATKAFRRWLARRYGNVGALNEAWGTVFWSQEYRSFDEIDPPNLTVTEAHPAHRLDYRRFASDEVVAFNREQTAILRKHSPGRDVTHNYMGFFTEFDHHDVSADLDVATWDSYPLGFTQNFFFTAAEKQTYARVGHPDIPAFHHDLYRGMCRSTGKGRWWVMEQQPGPVNWAQWNPSPEVGMVKLWTWQAFAHGAEVVSYFRWRQAPFAQEQMHTGLLRPDRSVDQGGVEAAQVHQELQSLARSVKLEQQVVKAQVALLVDYPSLWMAQIQPQGADYNPLELSFRVYSALRQLGLDVDILPSKADLSGYRLVVLPAHLRTDAGLAQRLERCGAHIVLGPRAGSKSEHLSIPPHLPPGDLASLAGVQVTRVESLPPGVAMRVALDSNTAPTATRWREHLQCQAATVEARFDDGHTAIARHGRTRYVGAWLDDGGWATVLGRAASEAGLTLLDLPKDLRVSHLGDLVFALNFSYSAVTWEPPSKNVDCLIGSRELAPQAMSVWRVVPS
jgi:beta-galactosidase